jgi:hypothetical protein
MPHVSRSSSFALAACLLSACVPSKPERQNNSRPAHPASTGTLPGAPNGAPPGRVMLPHLRTNMPLRRLAKMPRNAPATAPARHDAGHAATSPASAPAEAAKDPLITEPFMDDFNGARLGDEWRSTGADWKLSAGRLCVEGASNHDLWLKRRLPAQARIEFDAIANSSNGGIRAEVWGDGQSADSGAAATRGTGYLAIFGGKNNTYDYLARLNEGAPGRPAIRLEHGSSDLRAQPVVRGARYHFKIERSDKTTLHWFVNDIEILTFTDADPLAGPGHDHFAFTDWHSPVCFDNLEITPLGGK